MRSSIYVTVGARRPCGACPLCIS